MKKPEWLDEALAGAPVVLRDSSKGYVRHCEQEFDVNYELLGYKVCELGRVEMMSWTFGGFHLSGKHTADNDIIGLWQEPAPVFEYWHLLKDDYVAIAMDSSGDWYAYTGTELVCSDVYKQWIAANAEILLLSDLLTKEAFPTVSDWRQSLILRPEGENK